MNVSVSMFSSRQRLGSGAQCRVALSLNVAEEPDRGIGSLAAKCQANELWKMPHHIEPGTRQRAGSPGTLGAPASCQLCGPRRIKKARRFPEATTLCCADPMRARRPRSQGEASPNGCYPEPPRGLDKDSIRTFAYVY